MFEAPRRDMGGCTVTVNYDKQATGQVWQEVCDGDNIVSATAISLTELVIRMRTCHEFPFMVIYQKIRSKLHSKVFRHGADYPSDFPTHTSIKIMLS